jgi:hypothetical protein
MSRHLFYAVPDDGINGSARRLTSALTCRAISNRTLTL